MIRSRTWCCQVNTAGSRRSTGIGDRYHPLPWSVLKYDTRQGGYAVGLDRSVLEGAPTYGSTETPNWSDRRWGEQVHKHYGVRPYWE